MFCRVDTNADSAYGLSPSNLSFNPGCKRAIIVSNDDNNHLDGSFFKGSWNICPVYNDENGMFCLKRP